MTEIDTAAEAAVEPASEQAEAPKGRDFEGEARQTGWTPKDEWKGDPEDWKTARQFVEYGELKSGFDKRIAKLEKTSTKAFERLQRAHEKELADLKTEKRAAVAKGDVKAVDAIDEQIEDLKASAPEKVAEGGSDKSTADEASAVADWQFDNPWFNEPGAMSQYAKVYADGLPDKMDPAEVRRKVDAKMREKFPKYDWDKKAETAAPTKPAGANGHAPVDGGGAFPGSVRSGKGEHDLPAEAKAAADKFIKQGLYKTRAEYAKDYWADQKG